MRKLVVELWFDDEEVKSQDKMMEVSAAVARGIDKEGYQASELRWEDPIKPETVESIDFGGIKTVRALIDEVFADDEERLESSTCSGYLWNEVIIAQDVDQCVREFMKDFCAHKEKCDCDFYDRLEKAFPVKTDGAKEEVTND